MKPKATWPCSGRGLRVSKSKKDGLGFLEGQRTGSSKGFPCGSSGSFRRNVESLQTCFENLAQQKSNRGSSRYFTFFDPKSPIL